MKKIIALLVVGLLVIGVSGMALAQDLAAGEKKVHDEFKNAVAKDRILNVDQFKKVWEEVLAGKKKAYLLDVRTHPEFYAFHIEGTDHIHAGHVYTIAQEDHPIQTLKFTSFAGPTTGPIMWPVF